MKNRLGQIVSLGFFISLPSFGFAEDLKINALGCILSIPDVSEISVTGSGNVVFSFRTKDPSRIQTITTSRYPGDEAWNAGEGDNKRSTVIFGKVFNFDEKIASLKDSSSQLKLQVITDHKAVLSFNVVDADLGNFLNCEN